MWYVIECGSRDTLRRVTFTKEEAQAWVSYYESFDGLVPVWVRNPWYLRLLGWPYLEKRLLDIGDVYIENKLPERVLILANRLHPDSYSI